MLKKSIRDKAKATELVCLKNFYFCDLIETVNFIGRNCICFNIR